MRALFAWSLATCIAVLSPSPASAQQTPPPAATPSASEAWTAYATPGPEHAVLARRVGSWDVTVQSWRAPDAAPRESKGTSQWRALLGERFFEERFEIVTPDGTYSAIGVAGFDKIRRRYVSTWIDNEGTAILHSTGTADTAGKVLTFASDTPDPVRSEVRQIRTVETEIDANTWTMEAYRTDPTGREYRSAIFTYRRR